VFTLSTSVYTVNQRLHCQPAFTLSTSVYIVNQRLYCQPAFTLSTSEQCCQRQTAKQQTTRTLGVFPASICNIHKRNLCQFCLTQTDYWHTQAQSMSILPNSNWLLTHTNTALNFQKHYTGKQPESLNLSKDWPKHVPQTVSLIHEMLWPCVDSQSWSSVMRN